MGSLVALLVSLFTSNLFIQTAAFVFSSIILIFATKSFADKFTKKDFIATNFYTLNGKKGIVIEEINPKEGKGQIKVSGEVWSALCDENLVIPKDSEVEIVKIQGVKAFVTPLKIPNAQN
jgi:membrane protein implicated in regulation of membrane protease activity